MPHRLLLRMLCWCALLGWIRPSPTQAQDTLRVGLAEAVQRALEHSPEVGQARADLAYAQARNRLARASRFLTEFQAQTAHAAAPGLIIPEDNTYPTDALYLNPDVRNDWDDLRPFNRVEISALQPLWTWGELGGNIRAAQQGVAVEAAAVAGTRRAVARRTAELYYNLLLTEALFRLTDQARDILDRAKAEVQRLLDEGDPGVDDADLFQLQITEQEYQRRVVEVTQRRLTVRSALRRQLLLPDHVVVDADTSVLAPIAFTPDSLDTYLALALAHRDELAQARAGLAAREALVEVARSDYYPKLFLAASSAVTYTAGRYRQPNPYVGDPFRGRSARAGVGLRLKLNWPQVRARVQQAQAQRNEVAHQLEAARQLVQFQVEEAYRNLLIARAALQAQDEALRLSREWLRTEQINFDLDLGDTENLVDAARTNLELQATYYEAVRDYNVAVIRLLDAAGVLVDRLGNGTFVD
ncbi:transporter [Rhodothermaceae bacterium RA]|nr:transporter [Rhodothermaceae bacterium RA]